MNKLLLILALFGATTLVWSHGSHNDHGSDDGHSTSYSQQRIKVYQRNSVTIDRISNGYRSNGPLVLSVGDVTRSQVRTTVSVRANGDVYRTVSLREGESIEFNYGNMHYQLKLITLMNKPIGNDYAVFNLVRSF